MIYLGQQESKLFRVGIQGDVGLRIIMFEYCPKVRGLEKSPNIVQHPFITVSLEGKWSIAPNTISINWKGVLSSK